MSFPKSKFKNVYWHADISKWYAKVKVNYKAHHIGCFSTEDEAHSAVVDFKIKHGILNAAGEIPTLLESFTYSDGLLIANFRSQNYSVGDVVGSVCKTHGYVKVGYCGKLFNAHRIIWEMIYGKIPDGLEIDHINGSRSDNRIENLRLVSREENTHNRKIQFNNKTGLHGVKFVKNRKLPFEVLISTNGKRIYLGAFSDFFEACCTRKSAELSFNYHENHGRLA